MTTVAELIKQLSQINPDCRVILRGYEGGFKDVTLLIEKPIRVDVNTSWYYGPHEEDTVTFNEIAYLID
jgi:hypothetical protein